MDSRVSQPVTVSHLPTEQWVLLVVVKVLVAGMCFSIRVHAHLLSLRDRVLPGKRMAGNMGNERHAVQHLKVMKTDDVNGLILVKG